MLRENWIGAVNEVDGLVGVEHFNSLGLGIKGLSSLG